MQKNDDFDPSLMENIPDLSAFYTDSVLTQTAILEDSIPPPEPVLEPTIEKLEERYSNFEQIAEGGQKNIYQVKDEYTARIIAMAIIRDKSAKRQNECNRFIQEARIAANLQHPNIVPIHDIGVTADGKPFFTMKLIRGENLGSIIQKIRDGFPQYQKKYDLSRLLTIYQKVCNAVRFSHSKGIIHLDLKPENIEVGDFGEVMVVDWGLAKLVKQDDHKKPKDMISTVHRHLAQHNDDARQTVHGLIKGSPGYMSPEQAIGDINAKDYRTDIYALGGILYSILTLERPTVGDNFSAIVKETISGKIIPPNKRTKKRYIPDSLNAVTMKAMATDSDQRYQSVKELEDEVNSFIKGFATLAENASLLTQFVLMFKRHKVELSIILSSFLILVISFLTIFHRVSLEKKNASDALSQLKNSRNELSSKIDLLELSRTYIEKRKYEKATIFLQEIIIQALSEERVKLAGKELKRINKLKDLEVKSSAYYAKVAANLSTLKEKDFFIKDDQLCLDLSNQSITNISFLEGMKINGSINLANNPISSIAAIRDSGANTLILNNTKIESLDEINTMMLVSLDISNTQIKSLEPLRGMPLYELFMSNIVVEDLNVISSLPLTKIIFSPEKYGLIWQDIIKKCTSLEIIATTSEEFSSRQDTNTFLQKYSSREISSQ